MPLQFLYLLWISHFCNSALVPRRWGTLSSPYLLNNLYAYEKRAREVWEVWEAICLASFRSMQNYIQVISRDVAWCSAAKLLCDFCGCTGGLSYSGVVFSHHHHFSGKQEMYLVYDDEKLSSAAVSNRMPPALPRVLELLPFCNFLECSVDFSGLFRSKWFLDNYILNCDPQITYC